MTDLDTAIRDHFAAKHPGQLVVGWAIVAATTTEDDDGHAYDTDSPDWQPAHHTVGLYRIGTDLVLNAGQVDE